mmetsp:Transcript_5671/g.6404  ORF Transcript_5671/g.6404 Transcript_5671/m.6404 type:complete len:322 (-) Transcript_5671:37-1002(-)
MKQSFATLLVLSLALCSIQCSYDEGLAKEYIYASALAYCPSSRVMAGGCKAATTTTENLGMTPLFSVGNDESANPIYMTILKRDSPKEIIVTFSGTKGAEELIEEITHISPKDYDIHEVKDAKVFEYFYQHYEKDFRQALQDQLLTIVNQVEYKGYRVVFTGHSLGGALAVHAAADSSLGGMFIDNEVYIYTYGQPRVGNTKFNDGFKNKVSQFYRLVHSHDPVPHLPPCVPDFKDGCVESGILIPIFPYHAPTEIFYDTEFSSFKICSTTEGEDSSCSDKDVNDNIEHHLTYFGVEVGQFHAHDSQVLETNSNVEILLKA